ncbi:MAG TPA: pseudouridine-5'-phosphate glycosidase [Anaeromyxobacteraceae bacterium]|nr:pseudouridine-5'-phosphate glycosidase [Anaeromyxobacteraceae bacterium]
MMEHGRGVLHVAPEVRDALAIGRAVVALETSVIAHGLPPPANLESARRCAVAVREAGAVPAFVALVDGRITLGASDDDLARLADPAMRAARAGVRDLAPLLQAGRDAGTTVSASIAVADRLGIRIFATGGIGGVHRGVSQDGALRDVSSDLMELSRRPVCVVSAGPKVVLDLHATAEELETLGIPVVGFATSEMPAFLVSQSGVRLEHRVEDAQAAAELLRFQWSVLERRQGVLFCVPPPEPLPPGLVDAALEKALAEARSLGLEGKLLTPFLLQALDRATEGASRAANLTLLENNARVAGEVAVALAGA